MKSNAVWFAEKQNGEIIELTEIEALTHFEQNNIAQRMRLKFIGTSDGIHFAEAKNKVQTFLSKKRKEEIPDYLSLDKIQKAQADFNLRAQYEDELSEMVKEGYKKEFEEAKTNGVRRPSSSLRITTAGGMGKGDRSQVLNRLGGRL